MVEMRDGMTRRREFSGGWGSSRIDTPVITSLLLSTHMDSTMPR